MERDEWLRAAWRVMGAEEIDARRLVFVDEMGTNISLSFVCLGAQGREGLLLGTPQPRAEHDAAFEYERRGDGTVACRGGRNQPRGLRDIRRADPGTYAAYRSGSG